MRNQTKDREELTDRTGSQPEVLLVLSAPLPRWANNLVMIQDTITSALATSELCNKQRQRSAGEARLECNPRRNLNLKIRWRDDGWMNE